MMQDLRARWAKARDEVNKLQSEWNELERFRGDRLEAEVDAFMDRWGKANARLSRAYTKLVSTQGR